MSDAGPRSPSGRYAPTPGTRVGHFELLTLLGKGGMGAVYRARDTELGRDVALKFLHRRVDGARLERFRREAEVTASLDHPGIVRLHATGMAGADPYLVCELVEGARSLDQVFPSCDLRRRVELVRDAARALAYAHAQGVVHRDVKPDNLLVGDDGRLRVADFGLAAARSAERLTQSGALVGTPQFMSPEQVLSQRDQVGPVSDVWALGVLLHLALSDRLPFEGRGLVELGARIVEQEPPPLEGEAAGLQPVRDRALAKATARRYAHAGELADALDAWLSGARSAGGGTRLLLASGVVLGVLALALVAALAGGSPRAPGAEPTAARDPGPSAPTPAAAVEVSLEQVREGPPGARMRAAYAFLQAHPEDPGAAEARRVLVRLAVERPLLVLGRDETFGPDQGCWEGTELVLPGSAGVGRYALDGAQLGFLPLELKVPRRQVLRLPDGRLLVGCRSSAQVQVLDAGLSGAQVWGGTLCPLLMALGPTGRSLALADAVSRAVVLLDLQGQERWRRSLARGHVARSLCFTPDGRRLLVCDMTELREVDAVEQPCVLLLLSCADGQELARRALPTSILSAAYGPQGALALGYASGRLTVSRVGPDRLPAEADEQDLLMQDSQGETRYLPQGHHGSVEALAWSPDGARLHSASDLKRPEGRELRTWEVASGREAIPMRPLGSYDGAEHLYLDASGQFLALGTDQGRVLIWYVGF